jgi:hypothetical protein
VGPGEQGTTMPVIPEVQDLIACDSKTRGLSISTKSAEMREVYRSELGLIFGRSREYFQPRDSLSGEVLKHKGSLALDTSDIEEIKRVTLRRLEYSTGRDTDCTTGDNLGSKLEILRAAGKLEGASILSWTLGFHFPRENDAVEVQFSPPNGVVTDGRMRRRAMWEFLQARGFLVPCRVSR